MSSLSGASNDGKATDKRTGQWQMRERVVPRYPFWFGGSASSFAATVTHPLDLSTFSSLNKDARGCGMDC